MPNSNNKLSYRRENARRSGGNVIPEMFTRTVPLKISHRQVLSTYTVYMHSILNFLFDFLFDHRWPWIDIEHHYLVTLCVNQKPRNNFHISHYLSCLVTPSEFQHEAWQAYRPMPNKTNIITALQNSYRKSLILVR